MAGPGEGVCRYIGRWRHRLKLHFRVWPKWRMAHQAIIRQTEFPINGIRIGDDGTPELWHQVRSRTAHVFEIADGDFDVLAAIPEAGAKLSRKMVVHAPGTLDQRVRKECWVEAAVIAYERASERRITPWGRRWRAGVPHEVFGETPEDALGLAGMGTPKIVLFERDGDIDEDYILREVLEHDAMVVLRGRKMRGVKTGVTTGAGNRLAERAMFWTVPGRDPTEDGGILRGYQFADRIVRWTRRFEPENREVGARQRLERMHAATMEAGTASRRIYFVESVVNRFAERVGMGRQRVMARFLDDGIVDWLVRSVDNVERIPFRETKALLRGRITDAVDALEFHYRAVEAMEREEGT